MTWMEAKPESDMIPHISLEAFLGLIVSDTTLAILASQIPLTLAAIASLIVSIRNGGKSDKIANSVDGTATKLQDQLSQANGRIEQLLRFYPADATTRGPETRGAEIPAKVEIVNPDENPVPTKPVKKP